MTHEMVWISRQELREVLLPLAALCAEIEARRTLPENSGDDQPACGFCDVTVTLGQLRAVRRFYDEAAKP